MPLDPLLKTFVAQRDTVPKIWQVPVAQGRLNYAAMMAFVGPRGAVVGKVDDFTIPGPGSALRLRAYTPVAAGDGLFPALVYFHGGGFTIGSLETHDGVCRMLCREAGCRVVAVDYRLAPEHKFPAAAEDADAALNWIASHAGELGIDADRIAVGGDSAGGDLAAVVCQLAKSRGGPRLVYQLLFCPQTQVGAIFPSMRDYEFGHLLEKRSVDWFMSNYVPEGTDLKDPRLAPLMAEDVAGLPPAYIVLAECDPLHDEGMAYAEKLGAAGVPVTVADYPGMVHNFAFMHAVLPQAREALVKAAGALRVAFTAGCNGHSP